jgi:hypothetical protein
MPTGTAAPRGDDSYGLGASGLPAEVGCGNVAACLGYQAILCHNHTALSPIQP